MSSSLSFSSFNSVFYFFNSSITCCKTSFMSNISCQLFCFEMSLKFARPSESNTKCVELYFNCVSSCVFKNTGWAFKLNWFAEWYNVCDIIWLLGSSSLCCGVWLVAGLERHNVTVANSGPLILAFSSQPINLCCTYLLLLLWTYLQCSAHLRPAIVGCCSHSKQTLSIFFPIYLWIYLLLYSY